LDFILYNYTDLIKKQRFGTKRGHIHVSKYKVVTKYDLALFSKSNKVIILFLYRPITVQLPFSGNRYRPSLSHIVLNNFLTVCHRLSPLITGLKLTA
jgi:hypothetical protein